MAPARALSIAQMWDGQPAPRTEWVQVELTLGRQALIVDIDAPFHADEPPSGPVGHTPGLWNHEVVELFLLGDDERYLELELGPHGHHLLLELSGVRRVAQEHTALDYTATCAAGRFLGHVELPLHRLPSGLDRINAYAIHGAGDARRYLAWRGAPGVRPDFHRLETFGPLDLSLSTEVSAPSAAPVRVASARAEPAHVGSLRSRSRARA